MKSITSPQNENYKGFKSLLNSKGIREKGQFLVFGEKAIKEIVRENPEQVVAVLSTQNLATQTSQLNEFLKNKSHVYFLTPAMLKELDPFGTHFPLLVCKIPSMNEFDSSIAPSGLELCLPIGDPSNLGAVLRSALAFRTSKIILLKECAHPCHPKSIRSFSGNIFKHTFLLGPSIHEMESSHPIWALHVQGTSVHELTWPKNVRLLVGEEGPGIPTQRNSFTSVNIPIASQSESLNAAIAASIALFSYRSQHKM